MKKILIALSVMLSIAACAGEKTGDTEKTVYQPEMKAEIVKVVDTNIKEGIEKGNKIPDFVMKDLMGNKSSIRDYEGKIVMLNFWATWCPPCRYEMPSMQTLYDNTRELDFEMLAISVDQASTSKVADFINEFGYSFPVFHDDNGKLGRQFLIRSIPTTYIVDQNGIILDKVIGAADWSKLDVKVLLSGGEI